MLSATPFFHNVISAKLSGAAPGMLSIRIYLSSKELEIYFPTALMVHSEAPAALLYLPVGQYKHGAVARSLLYFPAEQTTQLTPAMTLPYPALQIPAVVAPHPLLLPLHAVQARLPANVLYVPDMQGTQPFVPGLFVASPPYPREHILQALAAVDPVAEVENPAVHVVQPLLPVLALYVPTAQAVHPLVSGVTEEP